MKHLKTLTAAIALMGVTAAPAFADELFIDRVLPSDSLSYNVAIDNVQVVPAVEPQALSVTNRTTNSSFVAFCIELGQGLSASYLFDATDTYQGPMSLASYSSAAVAANVQSLFDQYFGTLTPGFQGTDTAAFQLALWELTDDGDFSTGRFTAWSGANANTTLDDTTLLVAQDMLANLSDPTPNSNTYDLSVWTNGQFQDLIQVSMGGGTVPEPGTLALLGLAGLAGLGVMRRKQA